MTDRAEAAVAEIEKQVRQLMAAVGVRLPPGEVRLVSPAQASLLDFMAEHPFATIRELEIHNGEPGAWSQEMEGRVTEKFRATRVRV